MHKHMRLRSASDFRRLREEGSVYRHPFLLLSFAPNNLVHNRYGFITAKHLGKAVVRNRVRRLLRESTRQIEGNIRPGYDIVLIARRHVVGQSHEAILKCLLDALARSDLLINEAELQ